MIENILIPIDGSDQSFKAAGFGGDIASKYDAQIHLLHVVTVGETPEAIRRFTRAEHLSGPANYVRHKYVAERILEEGRDQAASRGVDKIQTIVADGDPAGTILRYVKDNEIDLIVLGSQGHSDIAALILGSVSHRVTNLADCTCVIVR